MQNTYENYSRKGAKLKEIQEKILSPAGIDYTRTRADSCQEDLISKSVAKALDLAKKIEEDRIEHAVKVWDISNEILKLDQNYADVLYDRYIRGMTLKEISRIRKYSYSHVKRLHREGLAQFQKDDPQ